MLSGALVANFFSGLSNNDPFFNIFSIRYLQFKGERGEGLFTIQLLLYRLSIPANISMFSIALNQFERSKKENAIRAINL